MTGLAPNYRRVKVGENSVKSISRLRKVLKQNTAGTDSRPTAITDSVHLSSGEVATTKTSGPLLEPVQLSPEKRRSKVPTEVLDKAQKQLNDGDRGGAYLTLYKELASEQILIQAQITTYTGIWGSGALAGNNAAKDSAGSRYNLDLDKFSSDIAQSTIDGIRKDLKKGGTGRLTDSQFKSLDRGVWKDKSMGELFPGNVQFTDVWNHRPGDRGSALFSQATLNMMAVGMKALVPDLSSSVASLAMVGPQDGSQVARQVGKRPSEFRDNPDFTVHESKQSRFITVIDNKTGHVEAFWDKEPKVAGISVPQLPDEPLPKDSLAAARRGALFLKLGANKHARVSTDDPSVLLEKNEGWFFP